jgi:uncharacterized protein (DUF1697 family)
VPATRVAVLLRGVNVGRAKRIAMTDLAALLTDLGMTDVRTLLNSGNAVGTWPGTTNGLAAKVGAAIQSHVGFTCDVVVRTRAQLDAVVAADPLGAVVTNPSWYLVMFLGSTPPAAEVERLASMDLSPDQWVLDGDELYVWMPAGVNESPVGKQLAKGVLGVTWTGRNWSTVTKLRELL